MFSQINTDCLRGDVVLTARPVHVESFVRNDSVPRYSLSQGAS